VSLGIRGLPGKGLGHGPAYFSRFGQDRSQPLIRLERAPMGDTQGFQYAQHGHVLGAVVVAVLRPAHPEIMIIKPEMTATIAF
jgi:hypothetical protein